MLPLSTGNLATLAPDVAVPSYDRSQVRVNLVDDERFTTSYLNALDSLHRVGARPTVQSLSS